MKQKILIPLLFISLNLHSIDIDTAKNKILGKWYIYSTYAVEPSCTLLSYSDYMCKEILSICDTFIMFNEYGFETSSNKKGKYCFETITETDTISKSELYLNLDSTQYDITINEGYIDLVRYYFKYDTNHLKYEYHFMLNRKEWKKE